MFHTTCENWCAQCHVVRPPSAVLLLLQATTGEILQRKETLKKVEDLGAHVEEALIFDNK